ncbi:MAG: ribosome recycling factor [Candidatus Eremiobacteraeota bacterium]|nr:ribosome recycling factor [Candidatus Eremiobacteraeota bacterium]
MDTAFYQDMEKRMSKTLDVLHNEFSVIRTGRATPALLDRIMVEAYGQNMPVKQLATISVPDPRTLFIQPWDRSIAGEIEKAIQKSDLGINPVNDGKFIRLSIPPLTEERRKELVKMVRKKGEESKVALRNIRRDAIEELKKKEKAGEISEDVSQRGQDKVQKILDRIIEEVDRAVSRKEKEIMEV